MSHPNHHHHTRTSTRRPGPVPQTSQATLSTSELASLHTTNSPSPSRTSKKRRVDATEDATTTTDTRPPTLTAALPPANPTQTPHQTSSAQALVEVLTSQLEALIQTLSTLLTQNLNTANVNLSRAQTAIQRLAKSLPAQTKLDSASKPTNAPPHRTQTYAAAAAANSNAERPLRQPPTKPHVVRPPRPSRPQDSRRVIVDLDHGLQTIPNLPSHELRDSFNRFAANNGYGVKALAVEFTKARNMAITMVPPNVTKHLLDRETFRDNLIEWAERELHSLLETDRKIRVYSDDKWHRIVVHGIPLLDMIPKDGVNSDTEASEIMEKFQEELMDSNPWGSSLLSTVFLAPRGIPPDEIKTISACLAFPDQKPVQRLLREGVFIHGKHCRTSVYKPKSASTPKSYP